MRFPKYQVHRTSQNANPVRLAQPPTPSVSTAWHPRGTVARRAAVVLSAGTDVNCSASRAFCSRSKAFFFGIVEIAHYSLPAQGNQEESQGGVQFFGGGEAKFPLRKHSAGVHTLPSGETRREGPQRLSLALLPLNLAPASCTNWASRTLTSRTTPTRAPSVRRVCRPRRR